MAAEAIPLINALLEAMGLTAAGSAKGKKYDIPSGYSKKEQKKDMEEHIKRMEAEEAIHDDPYDGLTEEEKKKLAEESNAVVEGFGGNDNKNDKKPPKPPVVPASKPRKELQLPEDYKDLDAYNKSIARRQLADEGQSRWGKEIVIDDSSIMGGGKSAKKKGMSDPEAVQISREKFMEGKPNSIDTDKAVSEYKGYQKSKVANKPIEQKSTDILEYKRGPEETRMANKTLPDDKLNKALGIAKGVGKKLPAVILGALAANIKEGSPLYGADAISEDPEDFIKELGRFANSDKPEDKEIFNQMYKDYLKENGLTEEELLKKYSKPTDENEEDEANTEITWEQIKPEAERLINSEDPEDRKKGHELIEKYYLEDKEEPKKSKGKGLTGMDLY